MMPTRRTNFTCDNRKWCMYGNTYMHTHTHTYIKTYTYIHSLIILNNVNPGKKIYGSQTMSRSARLLNPINSKSLESAQIYTVQTEIKWNVERWHWNKNKKEKKKKKTVKFFRVQCCWNSVCSVVKVWRECHLAESAAARKTKEEMTHHYWSCGAHRQQTRKESGRKKEKGTKPTTVSIKNRKKMKVRM